MDQKDQTATVVSLDKRDLKEDLVNLDQKDLEDYPDHQDPQPTLLDQ